MDVTFFILAYLNVREPILIATNPVDIMTYVIVKELNWPKERVIGSGTVLDTSRLRGNLCKYLDYNPSQIHANIIGEHGDSSVLVLSTARIANRPLIDIINKSDGKYDIDGIIDCYKHAQDVAYTIIGGKGATYYGIGTALAHITKAIVRNENMVLTVSAYINGEYDGINDICLSVPCVVNKNGIRELFDTELSYDELQKLQISANKLRSVIDSIY